MVVHLFGATSSPSCSNFALQQTAEDNQDTFNTKVIESVYKTKWVSNIGCLNQSQKKSLPRRLDTWISSEQALGISWEVETDSFEFKTELQCKTHTRRSILSVVSSVYNPLDMAAPFVLPAKILLQDLCLRGLAWDKELPGPDACNWQQWVTKLPSLTHIKV